VGLERLFDPRSIAVVGASRNPRKAGNIVLRNLLEGSRARIYPVNPKAEEILGLKAYPDLASVPERVDLVISVVPAAPSVEVVRQAGELGIPFAVVLAGGFRETGPEGARLEEELRRIARRTGIRIVGPNCVGIYVPRTGLNTIFIPREKAGYPPGGRIAFVTQSGAMGVLLMDRASREGWGFSAFVNLGNRVDITEVEVLEYLAGDEETRSIALYLESMADVASLRDLAPRIVGEKPLLLLKGGRTSAGNRAAASHTGAMATNVGIARGFSRQMGIHWVEDEMEMLLGAQVLASQRPLEGDRIGIVTSAGGAGVVASDLLEAAGFSVPELSAETQERLREVLVPFASPRNPVDMTAEATDEQYDRVIGILQESGDVDGLLVFALPQTAFITEALEGVIKRWHEEGPKPTVFVTIGGDYSASMKRRLRAAGVPVLDDIASGVAALRLLRERHAFLSKVKRSRAYSGAK